MRVIYFVAALLPVMELLGCGKSAGQAMAECEASAYQVIGIRGEEKPELSWLRSKGELVRVCMVKQGFKFTQPANWQSTVMNSTSNVYRKYGVEKVPYYQIQEQIHAEANYELDALMPTALTASQNWN